MEIARLRILNLENLLVKYFEYKKDDKKFKKYLDKEAEKNAKDRVDSSVPNNKQQKVSESKWCTWVWIRVRKKKTNNKKKGKTDNENIWTIIKDTHWQWMGYIL